MEKIVKSLSYFRDLGGISNVDGDIVKPGLLFRTSELAKLSKAEKDILINDFHFGTVIDLRAPEEVTLSRDAFENNEEVKYYHIALCDDEENPAVTKKNRIGILKRRLKEEGGMTGHLIRLYRLIIASERAQKGYRQVFDILLNNKDEKAIAYHCTQGKDRTGIVSALILIALGVSKETIIKDYMGFNKWHRMKRIWIYIGMAIVFFSIKKAHGLDAALKTKKKYIEAAFDEIEKSYGTPMDYLKNQIGLTDEDILKLRELYLIKR